MPPRAASSARRSVPISRSSCERLVGAAAVERRLHAGIVELRPGCAPSRARAGPTVVAPVSSRSIVHTQRGTVLVREAGWRRPRRARPATSARGRRGDRA